jgi:hypothetical protein
VLHVKLESMSAWGWKLSLLVSGALVATALAQAPGSDQVKAPLTTREYLAHENWWPTKQFADQSQFAGTQACAACHEGIVRSQSTTQMALTMTPAANSRILASHTGEIFTSGNYRYAIEKSGNSFLQTVSDGSAKRTDILQWAFGSGFTAQAYFWWHNGQPYESRYNYFPTAGQFDRTPGRLQGAPVSLDMAEGRLVAEFEARRCLACHATALTTAEPLTAAQFHPGVSCEACHGPGLAHVEAMKSKTSTDLQIVSPARLKPAQAVDFCGACHGAPRDVVLAGTVGKITVRFPAYRLVKSRCWGTNGDARLTCFACHDPHKPLEHDSAAYDVACLRCHANGGTGSENVRAHQAACPVAKSRCTSCHMPKVNVAEMHYDVTDHDIRIVKANAPFPN